MKTYLICDDCEIKKPFVDYPAVFGIVFGAFEVEHAGHRVRAISESEAEEDTMPINLTIDDMEWEAAMVFGYDGWEDDEVA